MQKTSAVVVLALLCVVLVMSYQSVTFIEASTTTATLDGRGTGVGLSAAVVPSAPSAPAEDAASVFTSVSDAAVLGFTGAALWLVAAGVRRHAC
jgi:hypothetical protein